MMIGMMRVIRQTGTGPRPMHSDPCSGTLPFPLTLPFALRCGRGGGVGVGVLCLCVCCVCCVVLAGSFVETVFCVGASVCGVMCVCGVCDV